MRWSPLKDLGKIVRKSSKGSLRWSCKAMGIISNDDWRTDECDVDEELFRHWHVIS